MDFEHQLCLGGCEIGYRATTNVIVLLEQMWVQRHCVPAALSRSSGVNKTCGPMPATTQHCTPGPEMIKKKDGKKAAWCHTVSKKL